MTDFECLVEKFKTKQKVAKESQKYKSEVVVPLVNRVFEEKFASYFKALADKLNENIGSRVVGFNNESKSRFVIEGQYHRIYFQNSKIEIFEKMVSVNVIPIYVWKGVTKHMGPITFFVNMDTNEVKWDLPLETVEKYSLNLFSKLVDDEDFSM